MFWKLHLFNFKIPEFYPIKSLTSLYFVQLSLIPVHVNLPSIVAEV